MGGGLPLTVAAGSDWPKAILNMMRGEPIEISPPGIGTRMDRYDRSIFTMRSENMKCTHTTLNTQNFEGKRIIICQDCHQVVLIEDEPKEEYVFFQLYEPSKHMRIICNETPQPIYAILEMENYTYTLIGWKYKESEVISSYARGFWVSSNTEYTPVRPTHAVYLKVKK